MTELLNRHCPDDSQGSFVANRVAAGGYEVRGSTADERGSVSEQVVTELDPTR